MISKIWIAKQILPISILGNVRRIYEECACQYSHLKCEGLGSDYGDANGSVRKMQLLKMRFEVNLKFFPYH